MIVSKHSDRSSRPWLSDRRLAYLLLGGLVLWLLYFLCRPGDSDRSQADLEALIYCSAENRVNGQYVENGHVFDWAKYRSRQVARTGNYSVHFIYYQGAQKAMRYTFDTIHPGAIYRASVWRHRVDGGQNGLLVVEGKGEGAFKKTEFVTNQIKDGWEEVVLYFQVPEQATLDSLQVYVATLGGYNLHFDDLIIQQVKQTRDLLARPDLQDIDILIPEKSMRKLEEKRNEAFRWGILETAEDDWAKAQITMANQGQKLKAELRLKGDWLDHLGGDKWSFRIKLKGIDTWNRLKTFSIHHPKTRGYLKEYLLHRFFEREDVLTTRYDFIHVSINGQPRGLYAYEEHFEKILLEAQNRREGPILKLSEDGFWAGIKRQINQVNNIDFDLEQSVGEIEAADIQAFKQSKIMASETLAQQFKIAQNLLYQYRDGLKSVEDIFDIDRLAKFYAICDLMGAYHGLNWHNQRFYYNPVLSKLEPIGFDGYGEMDAKQTTILGDGALNPRKKNRAHFEQHLFMDADFIQKYTQYLYQFSSNEYIGAFMTEIEKELQDRERLLQGEFKNYRFNRQEVVKQARRVATLLLPYSDLSVKAHRDKTLDGQQYLRVANTHNLPVELLGYGANPKKMSETFERPVLLEGFLPRQLLALSKTGQQSENLQEIVDPQKAKAAYQEQHFLNYENLSVKQSAQFLFFRPLGIDSVFQCPIIEWEAPYNDAPAQNLFAGSAPTSNEWMRVDGSKIYFKKGKYRIAENIVIPTGYQIFFAAGVELDFVEKAAFISRSPVFMNGKAEAPILISSSDQTGNGFTILQAKETSTLRYVRFDHLNTLDKEDWTLTGAVSFYESDVTIEKCTFQNNHCEDGLNLIRSEFSIKQSIFSNTAADALDLDFCKGTIHSSRFYQTGNDAMDLSGSTVSIQSCRAEKVGDKGLSVGEDSDATVNQFSVDQAVIGLASKDLSLLIVDGLSLSNCSQGFAAYQKKPEYGGSTIIVKNYSATAVRRLHNIRQGCTLQLKDKLIKGEL